MYLRDGDLYIASSILEQTDDKDEAYVRVGMLKGPNLLSKHGKFEDLKQTEMQDLYFY
jgi:hypothetical protein